MAKITASGETMYGRAAVEITGGKEVEQISCDNAFLKGIIEGDIRTRVNTIANYAPPSGSMLQAYATICRYFGHKNVKTEGNVGTLPSSMEKDVIY